MPIPDRSQTVSERSTMTPRKPSVGARGGWVLGIGSDSSVGVRGGWVLRIGSNSGVRGVCCCCRLSVRRSR